MLAVAELFSEIRIRRGRNRRNIAINRPRTRPGRHVDDQRESATAARQADCRSRKQSPRWTRLEEWCKSRSDPLSGLRRQTSARPPHLGVGVGQPVTQFRIGGTARPGIVHLDCVSHIGVAPARARNSSSWSFAKSAPAPPGTVVMAKAVLFSSFGSDGNWSPSITIGGVLTLTELLIIVPGLRLGVDLDHEGEQIERAHSDALLSAGKAIARSAD